MLLRSITCKDLTFSAHYFLLSSHTLSKALSSLLRSRSGVWGRGGGLHNDLWDRQQLECNHIVRLIFKPHLTVCERRYGFQKQTKNLIFKRTANKVASLSGSNMDQKEQLHKKKIQHKNKQKGKQ